jgi:response regulator RpfG family c-di-GMP phosphodiesterase
MACPLLNVLQRVAPRGARMEIERMANLLIVDDEPNIVNALRRMCQNSAIPPAIPDLTITTFTSPLQALSYVTDHRVDLVISDYRMPDMDGAVFLTRVKELQPDSARIILSACTDMDGIIRAINHAGIFRFVSKPWSDQDLKAAIIDVLAHRQLLLDNRRLADEVRTQRGVISRQQLELERLERETPGITHVRWSDDGGVMLQD